MGNMHVDHYQAQAAECLQRAAQTDDIHAQSEWFKLARSWQALADGHQKTGTSDSVQ